MASESQGLILLSNNMNHRFNDPHLSLLFLLLRLSSINIVLRNFFLGENRGSLKSIYVPYDEGVSVAIAAQVAVVLLQLLSRYSFPKCQVSAVFFTPAERPRRLVVALCEFRRGCDAICQVGERPCCVHIEHFCWPKCQCFCQNWW